MLISSLSIAGSLYEVQVIDQYPGSSATIGMFKDGKYNEVPMLRIPKGIFLPTTAWKCSKAYGVAKIVSPFFYVEFKGRAGVINARSTVKGEHISISKKACRAFFETEFPGLPKKKKAPS